MKRILYIISLSIALTAFLPLCGAKTDNAEQLFAEGNALYEAGEYEAAAEKYTEVLNHGQSSWSLYYNLGNAYYRMEEYGQSILNYERARKMAPNSQIVKDNLALAKSKCTDNIEELPRLFLLDWIDSIVNIASPRGWRTITAILVCMLCIAAVFFFVSHDYKIRKIMFIIGSILILLITFSAIDAAISAKRLSTHNNAIITSPMVVVKGSPDAKSIDKFILHEGTKVTINDRQDDWWQIEIADGKNGWINSGAEEI